MKGDCLHAKQGKLPPNAVDESATELSRGCPRLVSLPLVRDINLSVFNSYKDHRNSTMHVFPHSACVFSSDWALPQCLSVCMKMSVELGLTLYHLRFFTPPLPPSWATIFLTISSLPALSSSVSRRRTMISPSPLPPFSLFTAIVASPSSGNYGQRRTRSSLGARDRERV